MEQKIPGFSVSLIFMFCIYDTQTQVKLLLIKTTTSFGKARNGLEYVTCIRTVSKILNFESISKIEVCPFVCLIRDTIRTTTFLTGYIKSYVCY